MTGRMPITAMSLIGKKLSSPSLAIASPPTPTNSTSVWVLSARISLKPS